MTNKHLYITQLDSLMERYAGLNHTKPKTGWLKALRQALGISVQQLANKLGISRNSVYSMEQRENEGSITLNALQEVANKMDMKLVYGFIPKDGSLEALLERKAREMATRIVTRTSQSMKLESQQVSQKRIMEAIDERTIEIKRELPKALWD